MIKNNNIKKYHNTDKKEIINFKLINSNNLETNS